MKQATRTGLAHLPPHGGKNGIPYLVNRKTHDESVDILARAIRNAKSGQREEMEALRRLHSLAP